jgi:hypothetical protein
MLVNLFVLNVNVFVKVLMFCTFVKKIFSSKLDLKLTSSLLVQKNKQGTLDHEHKIDNPMIPSIFCKFEYSFFGVRRQRLAHTQTLQIGLF